MTRFFEMIKFSKRVLTRKSRILPNFLIISTPRGGTTSLYTYLTNHPNILPAIKKEINFFNYAYNDNIDWYRIYFATKHQQKKKQSDKKLKLIITGEASPSYLIDPHAPKRIFENIPKIKLIALLRNPIDRAISHYHHNVLFGIENLPLEEAIDKESQRIKSSFEKIQKTNYQKNNPFSYFYRLLNFQPPNYFKFSYLNSGRYFDHLQNWFKIFPQNQILILKSEDLFSNPKDEFKKVLDFLELPFFDIEKYERHFEIKYPTISEKLKKQLSEYFFPHNQKLYEFLNRDFNW